VIISNGIETTGLHEKVAIKFCMLIGSNPAWILLGILSITGFLSLWISNAAVASMILPVTVSIAKQLVILDNLSQPIVHHSSHKHNSRNAVAGDHQMIKQDYF
jgi:di/tricarboxylate transporter